MNDFNKYLTEEQLKIIEEENYKRSLIGDIDSALELTKNEYKTKILGSNIFSDFNKARIIIRLPERDIKKLLISTYLTDKYAINIALNSINDIEIKKYDKQLLEFEKITQQVINNSNIIDNPANHDIPHTMPVFKNK